MPAFAGIGLAVVAGALARRVGFDRDRSFYPVILTVIASYYVLFAVMAEGHTGLWFELIISTLFAAAAIVGFRTSLWIVVAGLMMHGVFDFAHDILLSGKGVPAWWPNFCLAYDLSAALGLTEMLLLWNHRTIDATAPLNASRMHSRSHRCAGSPSSRGAKVAIS